MLRVVYELTNEQDVHAATPLMEAGVDSLAATELASRLRSVLGVPLSPTIVFEQPTPRAVAAHLLEQVTDVVASACAAPMPDRAVDVDAVRARGRESAREVERARERWRERVSGRERARVEGRWV